MKKLNIKFVSKNLKDEFLKLKDGKNQDRLLHKTIKRAFYDIENDLTSCIKIKKKLWPKYYKKYNLTNLWKYDLPNSWRLIFTIENEELVIIAIVLEWLSHKDYEKRFKY